MTSRDNLAENSQTPLKNAVASSIGVPLAPIYKILNIHSSEYANRGI